MKLLRSKLADQDLIDVYIYTSREYGETQADIYLGELLEAIQLIEDSPFIAPVRSEFNPPVRIFNQCHHLLIYSFEDQEVTLIRVLHERMDVDRQLRASATEITGT